MTPIRELLNRIRWDPEFGRANFEIGYFDRVLGIVIVVPFRNVEFTSHEPNAFKLTDAVGQTHHIPFHRVREVHQNGQCIWRRPAKNSDALEHARRAVEKSLKKF
jgi:uncharacterized protein (UPF0248 family)